MTIFDAFPRIFVINLPERTDRRRDTLRELALAGVAATDDRLTVFPAVRPADAGAFPSVGARGCFLSHLGVIEKAIALRLPRVLILEDDLALTPAGQAPQAALARELATGGWDFAYPGHVESAAAVAALPAHASGGPQVRGGASWRTTRSPLVCAHFYALNARVLPELRDYLHACMTRPPGHPDGGPMHVDGAYSMFRAREAGVVTMIASPSLGGQRSSRSDITENRWYDRLPLAREAAGLARRGRNALRGLQQKTPMTERP